MGWACCQAFPEGNSSLSSAPESASAMAVPVAAEAQFITPTRITDFRRPWGQQTLCAPGLTADETALKRRASIASVEVSCVGQLPARRRYGGVGQFRRVRSF